ncbi:hypothetical protein, partial [Citrobacter cronae]
MSVAEMQALAERRYHEVDPEEYGLCDDGVSWSKGTVDCVDAEIGAEAKLQLVADELQPLAVDTHCLDSVSLLTHSAPCTGHAANRLPVFVVRKTAEGDISTEVNVPARVVFLDEDTTGGCVLGEPGAALIDGKMCWVNDNCRSAADVSDV